MPSGRHPKPINSFDMHGKLLHTYTSLQEASDDLGMPPMAIKSAMFRKAYTRMGCYFARSLHFEAPKKKSNFNPLLAKVSKEKKDKGSNSEHK